jgi:hypothetical protein
VLIIDNRHFAIIFPFSINYVFVLIGACKESERYSKIGLSVFIIEETKLLNSLPFGPASGNQYLFRNVFVIRIPNKAS